MKNLNNYFDVIMNFTRDSLEKRFFPEDKGEQK